MGSLYDLAKNKLSGINLAFDPGGQTLDVLDGKELEQNILISTTVESAAN